jgi:hypothetical protein
LPNVSNLPKDGDDRGGTNLVLARTAIVSVSGGPPVAPQRDLNVGIILGLSRKVATTALRWAVNVIMALLHSTIPSSFAYERAASDLDKIVVYGNIYEEA